MLMVEVPDPQGVAVLGISEIGTWGTFALGMGRQTTWVQDLAVPLSSLVVYVLMTQCPHRKIVITLVSTSWVSGEH